MLIKVTDSNFDGLVSEGITLVDFKTEWCGPCKAMSPIIFDISNEYPNIKVGKIDIEENTETPTKLGIRNIPTILIFKDGKMIDRKVGLISKSDLRSMLDKHLTVA